MESDPEFLGPQALAKGMRFVGDPRDGATVERLEELQRASTGSGSARAATSATSAARRASTRATRSRSSAPRRSTNGIDRDMGAKHAKWFVRSTETTGWLRETELVPKTQGIVSSIKQMKFAHDARAARQGAGSRSRRTSRRTSSEARNLHKLVARAGSQAARSGHVQGEHALAKLAHGARAHRTARRSRRSTRGRTPRRCHG